MQKLEIIHKVLGTAKDMIEFARQRFDLPGWEPEINLDFEVKNFEERSYGGVKCYHTGTEPTAQFYLGVLMFSELTGFHEYQKFRHDPVIGAIRTTDWQVYVMALMAHEFAHMIQYCLKTRPQGEFGKWAGGHNTYFQKIYRVMREKFVNHLVAPQDIGVDLGPTKITHFPHVLLGTTYHSARRGKLVVVQYRPKARIWKFVVQCPITETLYKTTESRILAAQNKCSNSSLL